MGTAAWFSQWVTASVISCSMWSALSWPAWYSLSITAVMFTKALADSLGTDVSRVTSPLPSLLPGCHTCLVKARNPLLAFCCVVTRKMCVCSNTMRFQCEELSWLVALTECHAGATGVWLANCFQADISKWCGILDVTQIPISPWCTDALTVGLGFAAITAGPKRLPS